MPSRKSDGWLADRGAPREVPSTGAGAGSCFHQSTNRFIASSIGVKLWLLIVMNSSLALLLAGWGLVFYQKYQERESAVRALQAQAGILAESCAPALSFDDAKAAREDLASLRGDSDIVEALIYDRRGAIFASYKPGSKANAFAGRPRADGVYSDGNDLLTFQPVRIQGERIGTIFLQSTSDVSAQMHRYIGIMLLVFLFSLGIALLLSSGMQRMIATPIKELSNVARQVTAGKDYSMRAPLHADNEIGILVASFNEMLTEIERRDELLRESEQRYALAARGANDGLWDWKLTTDEIYFSPRWAQMLGHADSDIRPRPEEWFSRIHPSDRDRVRAEITAHRLGATTEFASEYRMRHRNGSFIWMLSRGAVVRDPSGVAIRMAGSQTDITEGKIADPVTGLPNRLYFLDRLDEAIQHRPDGGVGFAVLFIDLDRFKLVNDSLGHAAGDELLTGISGRLKGIVRAEYPANERDSSIVARLGGDEFAVLLNGVRHSSEALTVADRIIASLKTPFYISGRQVFGMVSIGIATGISGTTPEDLLRNADTAMYYAKAKGKARAEVFDEKMRDRAKARLEIETDLRKAIELNQLVLHYQSQTSLITKRVAGYEALVRWQHPGHGLVHPAEFIPIAEETDLIVPLGRWVLREACRQMAEWHKSFPVEPPLSISVNVSFRQLNEAQFVEEVKKTLEDTGLPPGSLKLELTESSVMANTELAIDVLNRLRDLGVGLEIDDFGTGYSSLSYLNRLPFDTVKIDRSFVKDLHMNGESADLVRTILDLARSMKMRVIAEGVETKEQLDVLGALGCDYGQGYYFSRPADRDIAGSLIRERHTLHQSFSQLESTDFDLPHEQEPQNERRNKYAEDTFVSLRGASFGDWQSMRR